MGLSISHDTWSGAYSAFHRWRQKIAEVAGYPPLDLMEGFYFASEHNPFTLLEYDYPKGDELSMSAIRRIKPQFPIKWTNFKSNPLIELLTHSDCDGYISYSKCNRIAIELEKLIELLPDEDGGGHIGNYKDKTNMFIDGLRLAFKNKERLKFQ